MEPLRPHTDARSPKYFQQFAFLKSIPKKQIHKVIDYPEILGRIDKFELSSASLQKYKSLSKYFAQSKFGKGKKTKTDKNIRNSSEILAEKITITPEFNKIIQLQTTEMARSLLHPYSVEAQLSKMVIYEKGGKFKSHIDAVHRPKMIFTLSVEIFIQSDNKGGTLIIGKNHKVPSPKKEDQLVFTLFYHDIKHEVVELKKGVRICLIFDVIQGQTLQKKELLKYKGDVLSGLQSLCKLGVKKIGFQLNHIYIAENTENLCMKGKDAIFNELLREFAKKTRIIEICLEEDENEDKILIYHKEILNIIKKSKAFDTLYRENDSNSNDSEKAESESSNNPEEDDKEEDVQKEDDENDQEEDDENDQEEDDENENQKKSAKNFDKIEKLEAMLNWDKENQFKAVHEDYLLGDVVFLDSGTKKKMYESRGEEMWLGNEGFTGKIYTSLAMVVELTSDLILGKH